MQRSLRASWPSTSFAVRLASYFAACLTISTLSGCSQIVDFDRSKIAEKDAAGPRDSGMGGMDSGSKDAGSKDSGLKADAGNDAGGDACDPLTHEGCEDSQLCCADTNGVLGCVPTSVAECEGCGMACDANVANDCFERTCGCGWMSKVECSGTAPKCNAAQDKCVECVTTADCSANATNKFCFARGATPNAKDNTCVACDPANNAGCDGTTPICDASATCVKCTATPDDNCDGSLECLVSGPSQGACQCAASSDCTTPTTPICSAGKLCVGCTTDAQCTGKPSGSRCVTGDGMTGSGSIVGTCAACDPTDDGGCSGINNQCKPGAVPACVDCLADSDCTGATPLCDLGTNTCVACDAGAIPSGERDTRCDAKTGANACVTTNAGNKKGQCAACDPAGDNGCADPNLPACSDASICVACTNAKLTKCNDNNLCTTDACSGANACTNTNVVITDGFSCTADACAPATGAITHVPNDGACTDDGQACTVEKCVGAGGNANGCTSTPTNTLCPNTDGRACTVPTCGVAGCSEVATNSLCNDMLDCTSNTCVGAAGDANGCTFASTCVAGDAFSCTVTTCLPGGCSDVATDIQCNDNATCTTDACAPTAVGSNPTTGCSNVPDDGVCEDMLPLTTDECKPADPLRDPVTGCVFL